MRKVLFVFGTRPEAIKLIPVIHRLKVKNHFQFKVGVSAQHREMLDQVLNLLNIDPDYDLNIMKDNQSLLNITVAELNKLEKILKREKPDAILVQDDTITTLATGLAAYDLKIKIGHVGAGLRTDYKFSPFPEEINRRLVDCLADFYFAPTEEARGHQSRHVKISRHN